MSKQHTLGTQFAPTFHRPFLRYFDGEQGGGAGGGDPQPTDPPAAPPAPSAPPAPAPQPPASQPPAPEPPAQPPVNYRGNPDEYVRELREEAKTHRINFENEQRAHQDTKQTLAEKDTRLSSLERENYVLRNAGRFGANPDALLDSKTFLDAFANVDLTNEDDVKAAIETALEKNSTLRATPTIPGMSGGGHQGGGTPPKQITLGGAVSKALGG